MIILLYAAEIEIVNELSAPGRNQVLDEAALAYRARSLVLQNLGRQSAALLDLKRAGQIEAEGRKLRNDAPLPGEDVVEAIKDLQRAVNEMQEQLKAASGKRRAAYEAPLAPKLGRIRMINDWSAAVDVVVDGVIHHLPVGATKIITRPDGSFVYEVRAIQKPITRTLAAGETFTIRVGPQ